MKYILFCLVLLSCNVGNDGGEGTVDTGSADDFMSRKKDTVYKIIYKTDTVYKTVTNTVTKHDTLYVTTVEVKHDTITVYKTNTVYKTDTLYLHDTITVIKKDTIGGDINSTISKPLYGVLNAQMSVSESENIMRSSGVNTQRVVLFYYNTYINKNADQYIRDGFNVQINFDYKPTSSVVEWCTDTAFIRKQAKLFFAYYKPYLKQIPFVAVENEWDNVLYHTGSIDSYLKELAIVVDEGHKAGFKVTDAAITSNALSRWNYSQLSTDSATWWKSKYFVGLQNDYTNYINSINYYASKVKDIPVDWINFHWYNNNSCAGGLPSALNHWLKATGKNAYLTNEFGVLKADLWSCTAAEVLAVHPPYALAYSGTNALNNATQLTADMLKQLND